MGRTAGTDEGSLVEAMYELHDQGAANVIVSRASEPLLVLSDNTVSEVQLPKLQAADSHGAGDSLTAGVAATLAGGGSIEEAVRLGAAAGMLNVTRHGLGTGDVEAVLKLRELVRIQPLEHPSRGPVKVSPRDLAERARES